MTIGEHIKHLVNSENYAEVRLTYSDEFIAFVRDMLPSDYEYFKEKEEKFQNMITFLNALHGKDN